MKHLFIYAHPNEASLNAQFKNTAVSTLRNNGNEVIVRDLNNLNFNPVLSLNDLAGQRTGTATNDVLVEQEYIAWSDCITFIYPIWWTGMPAIMKGYIDRIFTYGFAYRYDYGIQKGLLEGKNAVIINSHGKTKAEYKALGMDKALYLTSDKGIFEYCGINIKHHLFFDGAERANAENIAIWNKELVDVYSNI